MVGSAFNVVAGALMAVPILGYVFSAFGKRTPAPKEWIALGPLAQFPAGQTLLATYRNPFTRPWDGPTAIFGGFAPIIDSFHD